MVPWSLGPLLDFHFISYHVNLPNLGPTLLRSWQSKVKINWICFLLGIFCNSVRSFAIIIQRAMSQHFHGAAGHMVETHALSLFGLPHAGLWDRCWWRLDKWPCHWFHQIKPKVLHHYIPCPPTEWLKYKHEKYQGLARMWSNCNFSYSAGWSTNSLTN